MTRASDVNHRPSLHAANVAMSRRCASVLPSALDRVFPLISFFEKYLIDRRYAWLLK
ncbi:hypothetical protein J2802_004738 [Paraburkholderia caribensis]|nr:hypothetical protein [Paraburkholderia caribensis]